MTDQPEFKMLDVGALATLATGIVMCQPFSLVHEAAEHLLGHPVWTHEFVDPPIKNALIDAVLAQYPEIPVDQPADWKACRTDLIARYGETVQVKRGTGKRTEDPVDSMDRMRRERGL